MAMASRRGRFVTSTIMVRAMMSFMDTPDEITGPLNCGNPAEFTMLELAEKIIALTGSRSKLVNRPLPQDDPKQRRPDISLAHDVLGWEPTGDACRRLTKDHCVL